MILAVISDAVWNSLITGLVAIAMAWIGYKLKVIEKTGAQTHALVNSNMGVQLKISEVALRRLAEITNHPSDISAWEASKEALSDHEDRQAVVDSKETKS